jgi:hypothetical protein
MERPYLLAPDEGRDRCTSWWEFTYGQAVTSPAEESMGRGRLAPFIKTLF